MKKYLGSLQVVCVFAAMGFAGTSMATAQVQASGPEGPPKVLVIMREFLKPGKAGMAHDKTESAVAQAFAASNFADHYIGMDALSGRSRSLFLIGFDSFAQWGKDTAAMMKDPTLGPAFDTAQQADGELLSSNDAGVFVYQPDKSVGVRDDIGHMRYMEITAIKVRPGHDADWDTLAKMHNSIYGNMPNAHWAVYEEVFGAESGGVYIVLTALRSLAEVDQHRLAGKQAWSSASADQKKQAEELEASTFESIETNLFAFNPKSSYPSERWKTADPDFWGQK